MFLNNPATYLSLDDFKGQANDYDLSGYTDSQLTDILVRASGQADAIMRRSYLPQEVTEFFEGNGTNMLMLCRNPILYIKNVQLVMPGFAPFTLPVSQFLIDYQRGSIRAYTPIIYQSIGVANMFPRNGLPLVVQYAFGMGYSVAAPAFTLTDSGTNGSLTPGQQYDFTVTSRTQSGESAESAVQSITPSASSVSVNITPSYGALVYRVYAAEHGGSRKLVAESPATNYGADTIALTITSLSAPTNYGTVSPPTSDTSATPIPSAIVEAVRMIALSMLYEQNNLANRGVSMQDDGKQRIGWKSTEGTSGRGKPLMVQQAEDMLAAYADSGVY
jgi:hypothetical protein